MAGYIETGIEGLKDIFKYLTAKSKTKDVLKNNLLREIRDNIKLLEHRDKPGVNMQAIIDGLSSAAIENAYTSNFNFNKSLNNNKALSAEFILNNLQNKYVGWDCKKFIYSIEGKIKDIKNLPKLYADLNTAPINLSVRFDNLFYQIILLVIFIRKSE